MGEPRTTRYPGHARGDAARPDPYRSLFEQSADAHLIIEGDRFVDCNRATVEMLRYENKQDLLRTHPSELSPPKQPDGRDSFEKANEMMAIAFERGSHRFEWDHKRADGEVFPVEVLLTVVPRDETPILHVVWRDITERKALELQLRQTQKLEAIGKLAGGIAHDFNNLLVAILGNAELLEGELDERSELRELAGQIQGAARRAAELTRQLLAFSRKQVLQPSVLDLNAVLVDLERLLGRLIGEDLKLVTRLAPQELHLKADQGQLEQVVVNLVSNARDAMPSGGTVTLETTLVESGPPWPDARLRLEPGRYARLSVLDAGVGMSAHVAKHAFDPFFTTKAVGQGTGLGLSTVYGIVQQSQGDVRLWSAEGRGTRVDVYLPLTDEPLPPVSQPAEREGQPGAGAETILVAEDEPALTRLVERVLQQQGYTVLLAANGREALEVYRRRRGEIDLLLTDVVMPEMGGPETVKRLRAEGLVPRVLFASGYMDHPLSALGASGEVELIEKPFTPRQLLRRVREVLDRG